MLITRATPHLITTLSLLATFGLTLMYTQTQSMQRQMAETAYFATGWDTQLIDAAHQVLATGQDLPCPARVKRTMQGKSGTYVLTGEITHAQHAPAIDRPLPTCEEAGDAYLIHITAGSTRHPDIYQAEIVLDMTAVKADPNSLLRAAIRPDPPLAFTTEERP